MLELAAEANEVDLSRPDKPHMEGPKTAAEEMQMMRKLYNEMLLEKSGIKKSWTDYLPVHESRAKEEAIFVITSINDYLILFFRGQVLVALCDGFLLTIGFLAMGLNYAVLLGMVAGLLSIVPFLGVAISLIPALLLAVVQFNDWLHPAIVLGIFTKRMNTL